MLAAGIVAILGGSLAALSVIIALAAFQFADFSHSRAAIPSSIRPLLYGVWIFFLACDAFVIFAGIELIRLRNWARIALLVIAGCLLFFGVIGIGVIFFTLYLAPADPAVSKPVLASVLCFVYGIPIVVALWWLILLTRHSVALQFQPSGATSAVSQTGTPAASPSLLNNPRCPLAVRIVAWYLASFVLLLPIVPFLPIHIPVYYFGHIFRGASASLLLFLNFALLAVPGVGLLLVKRWSYPLTMATQLLFCANGLFASFSPSFESVLRATYAEMQLPDVPFGVEQLIHYARYMNLFGLVVPLAIVVTLYLSRRSFYSAADRPTA